MKAAAPGEQVLHLLPGLKWEVHQDSLCVIIPLGQKGTGKQGADVVFFRQLLNEDLSCASYMIADSGEAAVVDPKWEIEDYLRIAEENNFRISHILETHNHADHLSGRGRLEEATGALLYVPKDAGVEYEHQALSDGDVVEVGSVRLIAIATPGHRPEHTCFLVEDTSRTEQPWLLLTGDSLFVGVRPAHIGGSLCGGVNMSRKPDSTIGFERRFNGYLRIEDEGEFVRTLTAEHTPQPPNFERI